ncbi:MAG: DUF3048 domain-containing protein [Ruminococcaceae bacterium]|nr:DUF3048 domain-containing protein [Oscillospiraceae bacterium]
MDNNFNEKPDYDLSLFDAKVNPSRENRNSDDSKTDGSSAARKSKKNNKALIIAVIAVILAAVIIAVGVIVKKGGDDKKQDAAITTQIVNPMTGEAGYNKSAVNKRPVAVVVENEYSSSSVRPQWGLNEADIVLEGESEYSTRLLLFWADYTNMPEQIGPARSARPPFIRFSQLFDSIFIHAGLSRTKGDYIGADTVFKTDDVDHINLLRYSETGRYFGRDTSRTSTLEHTGYLRGENTPALIEKREFRTDIDSSKFTTLEFNETAKPLSEQQATSVEYAWSVNCPKKAEFSYNEAISKYTTTDFDSEFGTAEVEFENLIFLMDTTEYIVKENYRPGKSETYCDYKLSGGEGTILSRGTALEITWGVSDGKLWMKDKDGKTVKLNPGKSYIGYGSSNNGGKLVLG